MKRRVATNMYLIRDGEILLGLKKRKFGAGKWNGIGGKVEPGETIDAAAVREVQEEISVMPVEFEKVGENLFTLFYNGEKEQLEVHFYVCKEWRGEPVESEEMAPKWFKTDEIPYEKMLPDDKFWMPILLKNQKFIGEFEFDENWKITKHNLRKIEKFDGQ